jgi:predicted ATPase
MLTRLRVNGFKNLVDMDVRFGPFTCIAGANAVGKSNLFDAIRFLSATASQPLLEAANSVRNDGGRAGDLRQLFHRLGDEHASEMRFIAEMIVPTDATDDLGQPAKARNTFLRYSLTIGLRGGGHHDQASGGLEIRSEDLVHVHLGDAPRTLLFPHHRSWRNSTVIGERRAAPFISTKNEAHPEIWRHQDGKAGRALPFLAASLPRTVLSVANAAESPTAVCARREMQSWRQLQLEPTALRDSDDFRAPATLSPDGAHLPATIYRLAVGNGRRHPQDTAAAGRMEQVYARLANRLSTLINDVLAVHIDVDQKRELLTLEVTGRDRTSHPARSLSDGTLRFLALAVIELDPHSERLLCLEEPENGVHPERIPAMLRLLQDIAFDLREPIGPDNPFRQVIVNTHSPAVVSQAPEDSLLVTLPLEGSWNGRRFQRAAFSALPGTWRANAPEGTRTISKGDLLAYLNPIGPREIDDCSDPSSGRAREPRRRVIDRTEYQPLLPFPASEEIRSISRGAAAQKR